MSYMTTVIKLSRRLQTPTSPAPKLPTLLLSTRQLFDEIPHPPPSLHNPVPRSLPTALRSSSLPRGRAIHATITKTPLALADPFVATALIDLYARSNTMADAVRVFEEFTDPDVVMWTSVVSGHQKNGDHKSAAAFFSRMVVGSAVRPDPITVISLVSALAQMGDLRGGRCCHAFAVRSGTDRNLKLLNSLLNLYSKVAAVASAVRLFETMAERDVVTWSCMVACFVRNGEPVEALRVYGRMLKAGSEPSRVTLISVIQACASALDLEQGKRAHGLAVRIGFESDVVVSTSLIDMYMKCSCYHDAMGIFRRTRKRDAVVWAAVIGGCAQNGFPSESLRLFRTMLSDGESPDAVTMVKVLTACSQLGVLRQALCFHGHLVRSGFSDKVFVAAGLVDLYSKCGSLDDSVQVFDSTDNKDVVLWSSMIAGYGIHGLGSRAITTFRQMVESSVRPNSVTFVSVLSACSHAGLVTVGKRIFDDMIRVYGVRPDSDHSAIMVDLLGRSGELKEAMRLIEEMPESGKPHVWCALLAGCRTHENTEMGELVGRNLLEMDPSHAGYYNLVSNMYAFDGRWDRAADIRNKIKDRGLKRTPAYSLVEVGREVHTFLAGEMQHDEMEGVHKLLRTLEVKIREEGYVPES